MNYTLLSELLPLLAQYQQTTEPEAQNAAGFAAWLHFQQTPVLADLPAGHYPAARTPANPYETDASVLTKLLTFVYRYVRGYTRHALGGTPLVGFDDFIYLISLFAGGPGTRSELMLRNIHEKAAGTEVIRRLLRHELVTEGPHPTDRRRKVLQISETGRQILLGVMGRMSQVAQMATGDLTPAELQQLVHLLHRLDAFHYPIFAGSRPDSFTDLVAAHFPGVAPNWPPRNLPPGTGPLEVA
ncbi:MarR family winged helix-turn-helix transcriptional regulator [Hymenobacter terrenus]|uniref:MarR family winged helix-turn-helix transcriptional regulator n=1 Tax=Hymenobacter terrenus TaxID=1629124 RepID=UPI0006198E89|nr:MarR family winged helix-turn-helix transcriptional regulator [Hymenobacter terrenus]